MIKQYSSLLTMRQNHNVATSLQKKLQSKSKQKNVIVKQIKYNLRDDNLEEVNHKLQENS